MWAYCVSKTRCAPIARFKPTVVRQPEMFSKAPCNCCQPKLLSSHQEAPWRPQRQPAFAEEFVEAPRPYESTTVRSYDPMKVFELVLYAKLPPIAGPGFVGTTTKVWRTEFVTTIPPWSWTTQRIPKVRPREVNEVVV